MLQSAVAETPRRQRRVTTSAAKADPVFAAIENHRAAYIAYAKTGDVEATTPSWLGNDKTATNPAFTAAEAAHSPKADAEAEAACALASVVPTTMAGVTALLNYVHDFNHGALNESVGVPKGWASNAQSWPADLIPDEATEAKYPELQAIPFGIWVLENVREALANIGGAK